MAFGDNSDEGIECFCAFVGSLGSGAKADLKNLVTSLEAILDVIKTALLIAGADYEDELRKLQYQAELAAWEQIVDPISAPLAILESFIRPYADCDPVAQIAAAITSAKDLALSDIEERQYELNQYIAALDDKNKLTTTIDRISQLFDDFVEAIDSCGS